MCLPEIRYIAGNFLRSSPTGLVCKLGNLLLKENQFITAKFLSTLVEDVCVGPFSVEASPPPSSRSPVSPSSPSQTGSLQVVPVTLADAALRPAPESPAPKKTCLALTCRPLCTLVRFSFYFLPFNPNSEAFCLKRV